MVTHPPSRALFKQLRLHIHIKTAVFKIKNVYKNKLYMFFFFFFFFLFRTTTAYTCGHNSSHLWSGISGDIDHGLCVAKTAEML